MARSIATFLMFDGTAERAMAFYTSLFKDFAVTQIERYGPGEQGAEGSIKRAAFDLGGEQFLCSDTAVKHDFTFTPAMSLFIDCESEDELDRLVANLSENGKILMPPNDYGFGKKFAWVNDRFGVSWQINLA